MLPSVDAPAAVIEAVADESVSHARDTVSNWLWLHGPRTMPAYYQRDPAWSGLPYAGASVGGSGCGLTSASMAFEYWTRERCTPADLRDRVGDSCTVGGLNSMPAFAEYARTIGLSSSEQYWDKDRAVSDALAGKTVWLGVRGRFGGRSYGGHVVLLWSQGGRLMVNDPANSDNTREWTTDELMASGITYGISIWLEGAI